jgi:hypothetical protein
VATKPKLATIKTSHTPTTSQGRPLHIRASLSVITHTSRRRARDESIERVSGHFGQIPRR